MIILAFPGFICMWLCLYAFVYMFFKPREDLKLSVMFIYNSYSASLFLLLQLHNARK